MKKKLIKNSLIYIVLTAVVVIVYSILINYAVICAKSIFVPSIIISVILTYGGFVISGLVPDNRLRRFFKCVGAACLIAFSVETAVFNLKSFTNDTNTYCVEFSDIKTDTPDSIEINKDDLRIFQDGSIEISLNKENINAIQLGFKGNGSQRSKCSVYIKDDNFKYDYIRVGQKAFSADYGKCDFSIKPYGVLKSLKLEFNDIQTPITLSSIDFTKALPFSFSELRYYGLMLVIVLFCAIKVFDFHNVIYDRNNKKHKFAVICLTVLCSLSMLCFYNPNSASTEYVENMNVSYMDPYIQTFDAFQKGQVNLDVEPSPELLVMEDPYDYSARAVGNVACLWDRAFYNGKYYSYFGVAPVIVFYYPFYFISRGSLPDMNWTAMFLGALSIIFMFGAIMAFIKRFIKKPNFLIVILGLITSCFASGTYFNVAMSSMYTIQGLSGTCFLMLCLWCGFEACSQKGKKIQPVLFALCGLAFSLCAASKPTIALCALVLAPLFLEILFSKKLKLKNKLISVVSFMVPVLIGMGALLAYNNARFDSPFQFGAIYQLTVSDVAANSLRISALPNALIRYFFQPVGFTGMFPNLGIWSYEIANTESYFYNDFAFGALTLPILFAGVFGLPFLLWYLKRKKGEKLFFNDKQLRKYTYILMLLIAILMAWLNYCIAGIIIRYICDITPIITLLSIGVLLDIQQQTVSHPRVSAKATCAISIASIVTIALVFLEVLTISSPYENMLVNRFPDILYVLEDLLCFWN